MQKYKVWIILACVILCVLTLVLWLSPKTSPVAEQQPIIEPIPEPTYQTQTVSGSINHFSSLSQQDIEINCQMTLDASNRLIVNEKTRNCFEYFITQYGEKTIEQIQQDVADYMAQNHHEPALSQILDLWSRYFKYRKNMGNIHPPAGLNQDDPAYYRSIYSSTKNLRKQFFSDYEIEGLFGTEDVYHEYTLNRMQVMANQQLSESEKAAQLTQLFDELPPDWKENLQQLNQLEDLRKLTAEIKARGGSAEDIREMRLSLVGPAATQRLEDLDSERSNWKASVTTYLAARENIIESGLADGAKQKALNDLRQQHFKLPEQQLRVQTFEQVYDRGEALPFAE